MGSDNFVVIVLTYSTLTRNIVYPYLLEYAWNWELRQMIKLNLIPRNLDI